MDYTLTIHIPQWLVTVSIVLVEVCVIMMVLHIGGRIVLAIWRACSR